MLADGLADGGVVVTSAEANPADPSGVGLPLAPGNADAGEWPGRSALRTSAKALAPATIAVPPTIRANCRAAVPARRLLRSYRTDRHTPSASRHTARHIATAISVRIPVLAAGGGHGTLSGVDESVSGVTPTAWVTLPDVAEKLDLSISKIRQMLNEGQILAIRRNGVLRMPAELVANDMAVTHLPGVLNLLRDAGFNDEEAMEWLLLPDESLSGGYPAAAMAHSPTEVKRRAQALL